MYICCIHVFMLFIRIYVVYMYIRMYVCMHVCTYVCVYVCMYTYMHTYMHTMNTGKLEHESGILVPGVPYALPYGHPESDVPNSWLLL